MILDADLTVAPEDLPRFYDAISTGKGEFINGVRLVYPMEDEAMRFFNLIGNKFFSWAFPWLLGQPIKDTLCGTKVLWRTDYERIAANRAPFRRLRSVRRFRPAVRRGEAQPEDRRDPDTLPRTRLRHDQHPALGRGGLVCYCCSQRGVSSSYDAGRPLACPSSDPRDGPG